MSSIPLLYLHKSSPADFLSALSTTGFIHLSLSGSPIAAVDVARAFSISSYLYDVLPASERARFPRDTDPDFNGYCPLGSTALNAEGGQKRADWKEIFGFGRYQPPKTCSDQGLPAGVDRAGLEEFQSRCYDLVLQILDKLSLAFALPEGFFRERHAHRGASGLTLLDYPVPPAGTILEADDVGAGAHKDWGSVTLLFQEDGGQPGLEIFLPHARGRGEGLMAEVDLEKGDWHTAPVISGTVLVNLGLMMEAWTGGRCVATLHRVVFPPAGRDRPRRSIAYFGTPDSHVILKPVGITDDVERAPTVNEFFEERLRLATPVKA